MAPRLGDLPQFRPDRTQLRRSQGHHGPGRHSRRAGGAILAFQLDDIDLGNRTG
jgi:hypothetical protein